MTKNTQKLTETNAGRTIQRFWLKTRLKEADPTVYFKRFENLTYFFGIFKAASLESLADGKHHKSIIRCIKYCALTNDKAALQKLAYSLFAGQRMQVSAFFSELGNLQYILRVLLCDPESQASDIGIVMLDAYFKMQSLIKKHYTNTQQHPKEKECIAENNNDNHENSLTSISHGGGIFHIMDFLQGRSTGYKLQNSEELGMQVSYNNNNSNADIHYALRKARYHFDLPGVMKARIDKKYLLTNNKNVEAAIPTKFFSKISSPKVVEVDSENAWLCRIDVESVFIIYKENIELRNRILQSIERLAKREIISTSNDDCLSAETYKQGMC